MKDKSSPPIESVQKTDQADVYDDREASSGPPVVAGIPVTTGGGHSLADQPNLPSTNSPMQPLPSLEKYFPAPPLELDNSTQSLTPELNALFEKWDKEKPVKGACVNIFPSGEITGGYYRTGRRTVPHKREKVISKEFTRQARKQIRRAVECGLTTFYLFISLTFDPKLAQKNDSGIVDQEWAKKEFKRFLNTLKKKYDRKLEKMNKENKELNYIWVAEIQELNTKNIHFHILVNQPFIPAPWLVEIWGQAKNSVNVRRVSNQKHAAYYMLKYMSKGHCPIEGKRYGMTQQLLDWIKPRKIRFEGDARREAFRNVKRRFYWEIENNGGKMTDFGFVIPAPKREQAYRDRQGQMRKTKGVPRDLSQRLLKALEKPMKQIDFEEEVDAVYPGKSPDDVPF